MGGYNAKHSIIERDERERCDNRHPNTETREGSIVVESGFEVPCLFLIGY